MKVDFEHDSVGRNIWRSAVPMFVAQMFNLLYNIVDRIFIGRIPGESTAALAGVGLCFPIIIIVLAFANLFGTGGAPLFSISLGAKDPKKAQRIINTSFFLLFCAAIILTIVGIVFARPLLFLFGASSNTIVYALPYLRIYMLGTFFSMVSTGMTPFINAEGFTTAGMASVMVGALLNLGLDPLVIFGLHLGVRGAASATIISQFISACFVFYFLRRKKMTIRVGRMAMDAIRHCGKDALAIMSLGLTGFIMQVTNSLVQIVCNAVLVRFGGDIFVTVMTIVSSVRQLVETPVLAISEGTSPVMSYNYGAQRGGNVKKAIRIMTIVNLSYTLIMWLLIVWKPAWFISIFSNDKTLLKDAIPALHLYFFAFIFQGLQYSGQTTFKALNKSKPAIFFSLFRKVIMVIPLTLILPHIHHLGVHGVFMAEPVSNLVGGTACFVTMLLTVIPELNKMVPKDNRKENS